MDNATAAAMIDLSSDPEIARVKAEACRKVNGPIVYLDLAFSRGAPLGAALQRVSSLQEQLRYEPDGATTPLGYWNPNLVQAPLQRLRPAQQSGPILIAGPFSARILSVLPPTRLCVAMVRDPISRIADGYHYGAGGGDARAIAAEASPNWRFDTAICDHQTRALAGDAVLDPTAAEKGVVPPQIDEKEFERILDTLTHGFVLLGVAERMEDSLIALVRQLGLPLTAAVGPWLAETATSGEAVSLNPAEIATLRELNTFDARLHSAAMARLDQLISEDPDGFAQDRALLRNLYGQHASGIDGASLLAAERAERPTQPPRLAYPPMRPARAETPDALTAMRGHYLDLMQDILINRIYADESAAPWSAGTFDPLQREIGSDWPSRAHSMVGRRRMHNVRSLCEQVLQEGIPGDFVETGVWRGGVTIMMRAVLRAYGDTDRKVFVADSFEGVPPPNPEAYPADAGDVHFEAPQLAISQAQVAENFRRYGLLDAQVHFLPGWFKDSLPDAPIEGLAILRLDGDLYESTMDALVALYAKLSPGGFVIVDDYGAVPGCAKAIHDFRATNGIEAELHTVDWGGVYWRKP